MPSPVAVPVMTRGPSTNNHPTETFMPTKTKKLRKLQEIYQQVPKIECTGACVGECSVIPMSELEAGQIREVSLRPVTFETSPSGQHVTMIPEGPGLVCPMLVGTKCSIYNSRPLVCRIFGVSEGLACPKGCRPKKMLTRKEAASLLKQIHRL